MKGQSHVTRRAISADIAERLKNFDLFGQPLPSFNVNGK